MESLFEVDDIVYVQAKVLTVEEQEDDVRYSVITNIAKFFCTEKGDKIRRSADSQNMIDKSFKEGKEAFYTAISNVSQMSESDREAMFGQITMEKILSEYSMTEIEDIYNEWVNRMSLKSGDIVDYNFNNNIETYVVIAAFVVVNNTTVNIRDCTDAQLAQPGVLSSKTLTLLEPTHRITKEEVSIYDVVSTGRSIDADEYLSNMANDMSVATYVDTSVTGSPSIKVVISKDDVNYDEYYDEDD